MAHTDGPTNGSGNDSDNGQGSKDQGSKGRGSATEAGAVARIDAWRLFGDAREVILVYERQDYRLRRTNTGKLILTK